MATKPVDRRSEIIKEAATLFFEQGYAATSIDSIIEVVGGSKRSIYSMFGNKEGLFTAIASENADKAMKILYEEEKNLDLEKSLRKSAEFILEIIMSPLVIGLFRLTISEAVRFPQVADEFFEKGAMKFTNQIAGVLEKAKQRNEIDIPDCHLAADQFMGMIRGNIHYQVLLGIKPPPGEEETKKILDSVLHIFLNGIKKK